ncbi:hypothetical protein NEFER03_2131 [Nematocida sp. LUAm3]|nr:hypothetical protein NEFER03_2131 [Nematocida sp. LUAm3]KAI5174479.1 hypothetical protein NEFER02_0600 [Nematocida sp. LUAm2]KAI5177951.1 hypothetical protein NEFER01_1133 [Nematocida sp. LUAm1]
MRAAREEFKQEEEASTIFHEEPKKDIPTLKNRIETLEEQIKQTIDEYEKLSDIVDKLKIINTLLYNEVCREFSLIKDPIEKDQ